MKTKKRKWSGGKAERFQEIVNKLTAHAKGHLPGVMQITATLYGKGKITEARGLALHHFDQVIIARALTREFHCLAKQSCHHASTQSSELLRILNQLKRFIGREFLPPGTQSARELTALRSTTHSQILEKIPL